MSSSLTAIFVIDKDNSTFPPSIIANPSQPSINNNNDMRLLLHQTNSLSISFAVASKLDDAVNAKHIAIHNTQN
jgi:hypothetical protein